MIANILLFVKKKSPFDQKSDFYESLNQKSVCKWVWPGSFFSRF